MATDRSSFEDDSGETRLSGFLIPDPGASAGDVPTATGTAGEPAVWQAGGGSQPYGASYLGSFGASGVSLTTGSHVITFDVPADLKVGTDIALNVDGQTFEIGTDGWYSVYVDVAFTGAPDTDSAVSLALDVSNLDAADILSAMNGAFTVQDHIEGSSVVETALSLPPFNFKSGDTFQVVAMGSVSAGVPVSAACNIVIVRAA